jgi:DNA-binding CsgD family transcriptional regulator
LAKRGNKLIMQIPNFNKQELHILFELLEVLQTSLDTMQALGAAYPLLCRLVPVDHGALCVSRPDDQRLYDWTVAEIPEAFFRDYADIAAHDFVRTAVAQQPNVVLCDHEMIPAGIKIQQHPLYDYSRSNGLPIEQVMAVMFSSEPSWHGGLTLYRDRCRPFSEHERSILQFLTPYFSATVANCRRFGALSHWSSMLETSLSLHRTAVLVLSPKLRLIAASPGVGCLFERCFGRGELQRDGLPMALAAQIQRLPREVLPLTPLPPWTPKRRGSGLVVTFVPVMKDLGLHWLVLLDEIPEEWRAALTPTEIDVAVRVAQGWDNELVADDIGNATATTRTHLFRIFDKLGVDNRAMLQARFRSRA